MKRALMPPQFPNRHRRPCGCKHVPRRIIQRTKPRANRIELRATENIPRKPDSELIKDRSCLSAGKSLSRSACGHSGMCNLEGRRELTNGEEKAVNKYLLPLLNLGEMLYNTFQKPPQRILQDYAPVTHRGGQTLNTSLSWLLHLPACYTCSLE